MEAGTAQLPRRAHDRVAHEFLGWSPMATGYSQNAPLRRAGNRRLAASAFVFTLSFVPCVYALIYSRRTAEQKGLASQ